jgi:hypothetical protein
MNPEKKALWVAALRSGDFRQAQRKLAVKSNPETLMAHCCLGVLCELAVAEGVTEARNVPYGDGIIREFGKDDLRSWSQAQLPQEVAEWAGFVSTNENSALDPNLFEIPDPIEGGPPNQTYNVSCSEANDGYTYRQISPRSFNEIADLIEENL